jgi:hypothetical protein
LCEGAEAILIDADFVEGKDLRIHLSIPCDDAGTAYQIRGLCATFCKSFGAQAIKGWADAAKAVQFAVDDRCFNAQGTLPVSLLGSGSTTTTTLISRTPQQQVLCELTESYLKGYRDSFSYAGDQAEAGRKLLEKAKQGRQDLANDAKLNEAQRMFLDIDDIYTQGLLEARHWQDVSPQEKADEGKWLKELSSDNEMSRVLAIHALTALKSKKALPELLKIAADRAEKDNADRSEACRALGIIGDLSAVPDLVHLTYHYNRDTRFWAQISLVRLTGENFGRDVAAWRQWWEKRSGTPPISEETIAWATSPQMLQAADPKDMDKADAEILEMAKKLSTADGRTGQPAR